jgi:hypothetical protein
VPDWSLLIMRSGHFDDSNKSHTHLVSNNIVRSIARWGNHGKQIFSQVVSSTDGTTLKIERKLIKFQWDNDIWERNGHEIREKVNK